MVLTRAPNKLKRVICPVTHLGFVRRQDSSERNLQEGNLWRPRLRLRQPPRGDGGDLLQHRRPGHFVLYFIYVLLICMCFALHLLLKTTLIRGKTWAPSVMFLTIVIIFFIAILLSILSELTELRRVEVRQGLLMIELIEKRSRALERSQ